MTFFLIMKKYEFIYIYLYKLYIKAFFNHPQSQVRRFWRNQSISN